MIPIGISQRSLPPTEHGELRDGLDRRWSRFLDLCGLAPVPLPNAPAVAVNTAAALKLRGLVLSGGEDLVVHGGPSTGRDETERALLEWATSSRLPVLGVCRGAELLLAAFGAELQPVDGHVATTRYLSGDCPGQVACYHRYAARMDGLPPRFLVTAADDDVVEAFRLDDAPVSGVMWHPERTEPAHEHDVHRFRRIFGAAR